MKKVTPDFIFLMLLIAGFVGAGISVLVAIALWGMGLVG